MKQFTLLLLVFLFFSSCNEKNNKTSTKNTEEITYQEISNPHYKLYKPSSNINAVLILFGGYPEVAEDIKREFKILESAKNNNIAVVFSNYNQKLWLDENEKKSLAKSIQAIFTDNQLPKNNIYLGGFSSGGVITSLIGNYLTDKKEFKLVPKGIFLVDSPIDLAQLYSNAEKNIQRNFSKPSVQEGLWLVDVLSKRFGNPNDNNDEYEKHSVFSLKTGKTNNLKHLKNTKIRMYTEPDTLWWKENRMINYEQTNAYLIKKLSKKLKEESFKKVEYIPTKNKGYRANGQRHPHSWAIVDINNLTNWILNK